MYDVGGGTGFTTLGVVQNVKPENVTLLDQSPHQLAKARAKPELKDVTILEVRSVGRYLEFIVSFASCEMTHTGFDRSGNTSSTEHYVCLLGSLFE